MPLSINDYEQIVNRLPNLTKLDLSHYPLVVADLERIVSALSHHPQITSLNLKGRQLGDECLSLLMRLVTLKKLNLEANKISVQGVLLLKQLPALEHLNLNFNAISDEGVQHLAHVQQLKYLSLNANHFTGKGASHFPHFQNLQTLSLVNNPISSMDVKALSNCLLLDSVYLDNNLIDDDSVIWLSKLPRLRVLSLSHNRITLKGAQFLSQHFQGSSLNLAHNSIGDRGAKAIFSNGYLEKVSLSDCQLSDASIEGVQLSATLTSVDVSYNQLTDNAMEVFADHRALRYLDASRNCLGSRGIKALAEKSQLKTLSLKYNRLSDESVSALRVNKTLDYINLTGNMLGDLSAIALSEMTQVITLILNYNVIGDAGASALAKHGLLHELYLSCNHINNEGASAFLENKTLKCLYVNYNHISPKVRTRLLTHFSSRTIGCSVEQPPDFTKENLNNIFLFSKGFFCIISRQGNIQFFNSYFSSALGYESEELLAEPLIGFVHPEDRYLVTALYEKQVAEDVVLRFLSKNGDFLIINWCFQWQDKRLYLTGTDLSIQKKSEKMLTMLMREEINQARLFAKQQANFVAHLCHEIRNPVGAVLSNTDVVFEHIQTLNEAIETLASSKVFTKRSVDVIKQLKQETVAIHDSLADIKVCCRYAEGVLNDNLDASKIAEGKVELHKQPVNLEKILNDILLMSKAQVTAKRLSLKIVCDQSDAYWVKADAMRLKQIIVNLVSNAVKFTKEGQITVHLKLLEKMEHHSRFTISVKDDGVGLTADEISHLFERYTQANLTIGSQYGGSGLGLHIAKQLAELMGGGLSVSSKTKEGSEFTLMFLADHLSPEEKAACSTQLSECDSPMLRATSLQQRAPCRVLIVEDNTINSKALCFLLAKMNYNCKVIEDGRQALEAYRANPHEFDVILMDTFMPVMDGLEATKAIRQVEFERHLPRKAIITLSGNAQESDKILAFEAGSDAYLTKPFKKELVGQTIDQVINQTRESPSSSSVHIPVDTLVLTSVPECDNIPSHSTR